MTTDIIISTHYYINICEKPVTIAQRKNGKLPQVSTHHILQLCLERMEKAMKKQKEKENTVFT